MINHSQPRIMTIFLSERHGKGWEPENRIERALGFGMVQAVEQSNCLRLDFTGE